MSLGLPFWLRSCMCCGLTAARMSLPIYQLLRAYCSQLRFVSLLVLDQLEFRITLSNCRLPCDLAKFDSMFWYVLTHG
ncbi:Olfactory guanylyl cyclase GC-D [Gossypium arboreum]|uniref:Olfactory guanylyl cyclase GC-D n=1 Tax=Gossypium arboreum TaxID=29729 RepID=A0A0B0MXI5_GOSAR|nr:Olfactory guanylyl cyclase GC-D [Gossypium arboreum]